MKAFGIEIEKYACCWQLRTFSSAFKQKSERKCFQTKLKETNCNTAYCDRSGWLLVIRFPPRRKKQQINIEQLWRRIVPVADLLHTVCQAKRLPGQFSRSAEESATGESNTRPNNTEADALTKKSQAGW